MTSAIPYGLPHLGYGIGLRTAHYQRILGDAPPASPVTAVEWFEIISENYLGTAGRPLHILDRIAERYPVVMHGVSMSIGSTAPIDFDYLRQLKQLAERCAAVWISDHICWTGLAQHNSHDLLPVPYNEETLAHLSDRIGIVQDFMGRPLAFENPSSYVEFAASTMTEWDFLRALTDETGCMLLLDVNNVYVSCFNHGWDAGAYMDGVPYERVVQIHLAGHSNEGTHIIDTHDGYVIDEVWELYRIAHQRAGGRPTLLEWDESIPELEVVHAEVLKARDLVMAGAGEALTAIVAAADDVPTVPTADDIPDITDVHDADAATLSA